MVVIINTTTVPARKKEEESLIEKVTERLPGRGHGKTACVRRDSRLTSVLHFPFSFRVLT